MSQYEDNRKQAETLILSLRATIETLLPVMGAEVTNPYDKMQRAVEDEARIKLALTILGNNLRFLPSSYVVVRQMVKAVEVKRGIRAETIVESADLGFNVPYKENKPDGVVVRADIRKELCHTLT